LDEEETFIRNFGRGVKLFLDKATEVIGLELAKQNSWRYERPSSFRVVPEVDSDPESWNEKKRLIFADQSGSRQTIELPGNPIGLREFIKSNMGGPVTFPGRDA